MNKKTMALVLACALLLLTACGSIPQGTEPTGSAEPAPAAEVPAEAEAAEVPAEAAAEDKSSTLNGILDAELAIDYAHDYEPDIEEDVRAVVEASASLQEELNNIEKLSEKYAPLATEAQTQLEMNFAAGWLYHIWDTELNSLLSRLRDSADAEAHERLLAEQNDWEAMREEATIMSIGAPEEGGSFYPVSQFSLWAEMTKARSYRLANELAGLRGEVFTMPEGPAKYGIFLDNQGTGSVYSSLIVRESWEGDDEAVVSVYRLGVLEGTISENGDGEYVFSAYDESVKGVITVKGWDGASFEVTEIAGASPFSAGESFSFPLAFCRIP